MQRVVEFVATHQYVGQRGIGRVVHPAAELKLFLIEADEVVSGCVLNGVVVLEISLQHNFAGSLAAACASGDLGQELKRALSGAEVGEAESNIGYDHTTQRYAVNVVPFGDHLRTDQQVKFAFVQRVQGSLEIFVAADCVAIEPGDAGLRKHAVEQFFEFF